MKLGAPRFAPTLRAWPLGDSPILRMISIDFNVWLLRSASRRSTLPSRFPSNEGITTGLPAPRCPVYQFGWHQFNSFSTSACSTRFRPAHKALYVALAILHSASASGAPNVAAVCGWSYQLPRKSKVSSSDHSRRHFRQRQHSPIIGHRLTDKDNGRSEGRA